MNIIFVSNKMAKAKSLSIWQTSLLLVLLMLVPVLLTMLFITPPSSIKEQGMKALLPPHLKSSIISSQVHLDAYARELGELQARMMRLDAQGQRLAKLAGEKDKQIINNPDFKPRYDVKPAASPNNKAQARIKTKLRSGVQVLEGDEPLLKEVDPADEVDSKANDNVVSNSPLINAKSLASLALDGRGGPLVNARPMTELDLQAAIVELTKAVDARDDYLSTIEAKLLQKSVLKDMLPNSSPVEAGYNSSSYGWRIDPFNGNKAFHEGLDFPAATGTVIHAAADGIVSMAELSAAYGNIVKIEHGAGLETRYAHASKLLVRVGERVTKGQAVALVGSTGRSTGPHLHYEIRFNGNSLDPRKYLQS
jgi:murein DD-endopeptidase MepM/ murein hydrolase activator NlpD